MLAAIDRQCEHGLNGWRISLQRATLERPGALPVVVWDEALTDECNPSEKLDAAPYQLLTHWSARAGSTVHALHFRAPLLLASHGAQRRRLADSEAPAALPWPTLGSILESLAKRVRTLEPALAETLGIAAGWAAPARAHGAQAIIWATNPAQQVQWRYTSAPKPRASSKPENPGRRALTLPGIVGTLIYLCELSATETTLLDLGQWLGVGQKTTMGCGSYALVNVLSRSMGAEEAIVMEASAEEANE